MKEWRSASACTRRSEKRWHPQGTWHLTDLTGPRCGHKYTQTPHAIRFPEDLLQNNVSDPRTSIRVVRAINLVLHHDLIPSSQRIQQTHSFTRTANNTNNPLVSVVIAKMYHGSGSLRFVVGRSPCSGCGYLLECRCTFTMLVTYAYCPRSTCRIFTSDACKNSRSFSARNTHIW